VPAYATDMVADVRGLRLGIDRAYCSVGDSTVLDAFDAALRQLEELGCSFHEISMPAIDELFLVDNTIFQPEVLRAGSGPVVPDLPPPKRAAL